MAEKLARAIESTDLTPEERQIAEDIVRSLAQDVAVAVRHALSHSLRRAAHLPRDVALRLANDLEDVALPIVADSPVLLEADLIEIIRTGSQRKQVVVAGRPDVSEPMAEALINIAAEPAVMTQMDNAQARIATLSFGKALDRFADGDEVKERKMKRTMLPPNHHRTPGGDGVRSVAALSSDASRAASGAGVRHCAAGARSGDAQFEQRLQ